MAATTKFSKQTILDTALNLLIAEGHEAVTIKRLAQEVGCSTQPISWVFGSMEQLRLELARYAREYFHQQLFTGGGTPLEVFQHMPVACLDMSYNQPNLLRFIRVTSNRFLARGGVENWFDPRLNGDLQTAVAEELGITRDQALTFIQTMLIYFQGIGSLIGTDSIQMDREMAMRMICDCAALCLRQFGVSRGGAWTFFHQDALAQHTA